MLVIETEYANFGNPKDLLRYMREEGIKVVHATTKYCLAVVGLPNFELTLSDVEAWVDGR